MAKLTNVKSVLLKVLLKGQLQHSMKFLCWHTISRFSITLWCLRDYRNVCAIILVGNVIKMLCYYEYVTHQQLN